MIINHNMTYKFNDHYNPTNKFQIDYKIDGNEKSHKINESITIKYISEDNTILFQGIVDSESTYYNKCIPSYISIPNIFNNFKVAVDGYIDHEGKYVVYHTKYSPGNNLCITFIESYKSYFYEYSITINKDSTKFKFHKMMSEDEKLYIHYVLKLKNNKWYNGKTEIDNFWMRMSDHEKMTDRSNKFVTTHGFSSIDSITFGNSHVENSIHLHNCVLYRIHNVRGAAFTTENIKPFQESNIKHLINSTYDKCYKCKQIGHFANECPTISGTKRKREEDSEKIQEPVSKKSRIEEPSQYPKEPAPIKEESDKKE